MASFLRPAAGSLASLVEGFDRDPVECRKEIRELAERDPEAFYASAIEVLKARPDSRGAHYVVAMLAANGRLLQVLCDRTLNRALAVKVVRVAVGMDAMADVTLARRIAEGVEPGNECITPADAGRLLEILGEVSPLSRLLPSLVKLLRHSDPYLRSKAVLLAGRANRSARWTGPKLNDPDARIRANALEGLWGVVGDGVRELLQSAASDWNNRVAGNALLGLYRLGDSSTIPEILAMAAHESELFRTTAAWVMGETGSARFQEYLAGMLRDSSPVVRKRVFAALRRIKGAAPTAAGLRCRLACRLYPDDQKAKRRLLVSMATDDSKEQPVLLATQLILNEDGKPVCEYKLTERPVADPLAVVFLFPRPAGQSDSAASQAAVECLRWKRTSDHFASEHYLTEGGSDGDIWLSLLRVLQSENSGIRGKRHLILFNSSQTPDKATPELLPALSSHGTLQVISSVADPVLEALCAKTDGSFELAASEEQVKELIINAYLRLLARFEISYQPLVADASEIRVRVEHPRGRAETRVAI